MSDPKPEETKTETSPSTDEITDLIKQAKELKNEKKFDEAIKLLEQAIEQGKDQKDQEKNLGDAHETLKFIYCEVRKFDQALEQAEKTLTIFTQLDDKQRMSDNMHDIAFVLASNGNHQKAIEKYDEALTFTKEQFGEDHDNVALIYEHEAQSKAQEKVFDEALSYGEKSYKLREKNKGEYSQELIPSCMTLWNIYQMLGQILEGLPYYKRFLDIRTKGVKEGQKVEGLNDYAVSYNKSGNYYLQVNDAKMALECYERAFDLFMIAKDGKKDSVEVLECIFNKGKALYFLQKYDDALENLKIALEGFKKAFEKGNSRTATTYDMIATIYFKTEKFDDAIANYDNALKVFIELGQNPPDTYMKLSFALLKKNEPQKLLESLRKYMELNKEKHGSDSLNFVDSLLYVGDFCKNNQKFQEAVDTYQEVTKIYEPRGEKFEVALANVYAKLGFAYAALHKKKESFDAFRKSADLQAKHIEKKDPNNKPEDLVYTLNTLTQGSLAEDDMELAIEFIQKSLSISSKYLGNKHKLYIKGLYLQAACLQRLRRLEDALSAYNQYIKLPTGLTEPNDLATVYQNISVLQSAKSDMEEAVAAQKKALEIRKNQYGEDHLEVGLCYNSLGSLYFKFNKNSEAVEFFGKALENFKKDESKNEFLISQTLNHMGYSELKMKNNDKAEEHFKKCLEIRLKNKDKDQVMIARSHHDFGLLYTAKQEHESAINHHKKAIDIMKKALGENNEDVIAEYYSLKSCYEIMGENEKAIEVLNTILDLRVKGNTANTDEYIGIYENLAICYGKLGNEDKMVEYDKKVEELQEKLEKQDKFDKEEKVGKKEAK